KTMAREANAEDLGALHPCSQGITLTPRPQPTQSRASACASRQNSAKSAASVSSVPDPTLFSQDIGRILLQKTAEKEDELKKAFQTLDVGQTLTVTKGEFRRVIETFLFPLTQAEFDAMLAEIPNIGKVTVPYLDFLSKFTEVAKSTSMLKGLNNGRSSQTMTLCQLESLLKEKIAKNVKSIIKSCRLFDYNHSGQIKRHTLRHILEITCFRMKDSEFEKLWNHYCVRDSNVVDYICFLKIFGLNTDTVKKRSTENQVPALICRKIKEKEQKQNKLLQPSSAERDATEYSLDGTERAFRDKLCSAYQDIEKAFRAIDVSQSGFVSLDRLKSVINDFIFPLSSETFQELMNRFGLKATGKIAWQQFLEKVHDPGNAFENRQTIPLRKKYKVGPVRGGDETFCGDTVLQKLRRYIQDVYPSQKQAFLMLDKKRDGKITRDELRRILHYFLLQIKNKDFQELIQIMDPEQTGYLDYHKFLDLVEEKECPVAEILTDKITENWKDFHTTLQFYDPKCTGIISRSHLRKILQIYCPCLSDQQFMRLCYKYQDNSSGGIFYNMLLDSLKIDVPSDDLNGVGSHISKESQQREEKRQTDPSKRMKQIEDQANKYAKNRTVDEVIEKLKDKVLQQAATIKDSFLAYNKQANGKITKVGLRKILEDHGMPMDDNQFNLLTEKLGFPDGGLSYLDFVAIFEDAKLHGPGAALCHSPKQGGNSAEYHYMTAEECLSQLNDKLMEVYGDTYSAFRSADTNRDGVINMLDFRHLLDSFLFSLRDEEFLRLLGMLRMNLTSTLNYKEFCQLFETQETKDIPPWLIPPHKKKQMITDAELACDQAHYYLVIKARTRWHDLARSFQEYDSEGNGIIWPEDLKKVLFRFGIPVTPEEFKKLWARYDTDAKGYLTHQEFLQKLGIEFAPADTGLGKHITEDNHAHLKAHYNNQQKKHSKLEEQQKQQTKALHVNEVKKQIKNKFRNYFQDFRKFFQKMDKNRDGYVTVCGLQKILQEFDYFLDYNQFNDLLNGLGISIHDSKLSYFDFLRAIEDGRASKYQQRQKQTAPPASFAALSLEKTLIKIKEIVASSYDLLYKAFSLFDKEDTGVIKTVEFRQILDHFCFKLSDKQFRHLLKNFKLREDLTVNWKIFLKNINLPSELLLYGSFSLLWSKPEFLEGGFTACGISAAASSMAFSLADWLPATPALTEEGQKVFLPKSSRELSERGILSRIREAAAARFNTIAKAFKDIDSSEDNTVSKEEFWDVCNRHLLLLTEEQFENLWNTVDVNASGRLKYQDFLKQFSSERGTMPSSTCSTSSSASCTRPVTTTTLELEVSSQPERPKTSSSLGEQRKTPASSRPQTTATCSAPVLNCEPIENKIRKKIKHSWRRILKECKEKDVHKKGEIPVPDFLDIAEKFELDLSEDEVKQITTKYDFKNNGKFAYCNFLQSCILFLKPKETSLLQRMIIQKPQIPLSPGPQTTAFFSAMLRIQPQILHCWRPMRRTFKSYDESRTGLLNIPDFRQVLREYSINLTEEELFNILEYYDKNLSSKISYNDFLRAFLQ
ncbi:PREDICTED: EF-hand calcium-binding domain-containing protein 6, partial [Tinamus guttatus]|uniref:EF-hand calcium-binding domain-containing protein 6 n=1 Tax=Tinamus guttatus TaxID=94827 RepID=UPI00052F33B7